MLPGFTSRNFAKFLLSLVLLSGSLTMPSLAQEVFADCATRTETNATLLLPDTLTIVLDGAEAKGPVQLAVFTPRGECVGAVRWTGPSASLTVWGGNPNRGDRVAASQRALIPGDTLQFHLFDPATETEYTPSNSRMSVSFQSRKPYLLTSPHYTPDGIYAVDRIHAQRSDLGKNR